MNKTIVIAVVILIVLGGGIFVAAKLGKKAVNEVQEHTTATPTQAMQIKSETSGTPSGAMQEGTVKEFTVEGSNFKFVPAEMTVNKGDTVKITFKNSGGFHDFVIDEFNVKTKQISGGNSESVEFVADKVGSFEYYCSVGKHRQMGMKGTLTVK